MRKQKLEAKYHPSNGTLVAERSDVHAFCCRLTHPRILSSCCGVVTSFGIPWPVTITNGNRGYCTEYTGENIWSGHYKIYSYTPEWNVCKSVQGNLRLTFHHYFPTRLPSRHCVYYQTFIRTHHLQTASTVHQSNHPHALIGFSGFITWT